MHVLVIGGAGYIGSIGSELLISSGVKIIAPDNLSEGNRAAVPAEASFYEADFGDVARLDGHSERAANPLLDSPR